MYARVISGVAPSPVPTIHSIVAGLRCAPGFSGALSLELPESAQVLLIVFWETHDQAATRGAPPGFAIVGDEVWEVAARV